MISGSSMEFDFKTLKRKDLQRLCKKHGLRANSTNSQMADGLASLFKKNEMDKQLKVRLRGSGNKECERVEGKAERILIVLDEEDDEHVPVLGSGSMDRRSSRKNEYNQADLEGSGMRGDSEGGTVQPCEENTITFLDEQDTSSRKNVSKVFESRSANSEDPQIPVLELKKTSGNGKTKRKLNCRDSSMKVNDEAAVSPPVDDSLMINEVLDNTLNRHEIEEYELHTDSCLNTSVSGIGVDKRPLKRTRASLEVEISVMEKDTDEHIEPEVDSASLEILESGNPSNIASSTLRLFLSELQDGQDGGEHPEANDPLSKHRKEESEQEESVFPKNSIIADIALMEVVDTSGRSSSTSEFDCLSKDEVTSHQSSAASLSYSQEIHDISNERCSISANHNNFFETEESLVCKNSIIAGITVMEVVDTSDRRLSSSELDHVSKDEEASKQSLSISERYPQDIYDISKRCCSISTDHVRNYVDDCKKCLMVDENHSYCAETPVSINVFCLSSEQGCEALESTDIVIKEVEVRLGCHNSEGVLEDKDGEKRIESFMEHEYHKDKQDENECQDGYGDKTKGNSSFEKASPILFQEISIVEDDVRDSNSPSREKFEEMNDNVGLSLNIEMHDDNNLHYLAGKEFEKVGRAELQVAQKKEENVKTLSGWFCEALEENYSTELKLTDAPEVTANNLLTQEDLGELRMPDDKFQEQTADYEQNLGMSGDKFQEQTTEYGQDLGISVNNLQEQAVDSEQDSDMLGDKFQEQVAEFKPDSDMLGDKIQEQVADFKPGYCEDITEKSENFQKSVNSQHLALTEINSSQFFETYESATLPEELSEIKGGGSFGLEGTVQIIPDQLKHDPEIFFGSEELEESPTEKIAEIAPFGLSKRVDKLMEKLLCLRKVLRGEITPPVTGEEEISCEESHPTNKKQLLPEQKDEVVKTLMLSNSVLEDCEQYSSNSQLNINHGGTQCLQECLDSQADPTLKVESLEANNTVTTSLFECNFSCKPIEGRQPHQGSDIDVEDLGKKDFLSSSKHSIDWEGEKNSVDICVSKKTKLKHRPAEDALDGHIPIVQECAHNKPFDILEVESENNNSVLKCVDSVEEINRKLIKFRISSSRKATKSSIKTPRTKSRGIIKLHSSGGIIRDKENKQNTKMMNFSSSEHKIRSSAASAGSIRRPLLSVTNQKLD